jgi:hypothetical protein
MTSELRPKFRYDLPTAVTFLIFGVGMGWMLAMLRIPQSDRAAVLPFPARSRAS